jgi:hypothetical protein
MIRAANCESLEQTWDPQVANVILERRLAGLQMVSMGYEYPVLQVLSILYDDRRQFATTMLEWCPQSARRQPQTGSLLTWELDGFWLHKLIRNHKTHD